MRPLLATLLLAIPFGWGLAGESSQADRPGDPTAQELALKILDGEGLYTLSRGIKPASEGFWQTSFPASDDPNTRLASIRSTLASLPLGPDLEAGAFAFAAVHNGKRSASAFVIHRPALLGLLSRHREFFHQLGVHEGQKGTEIFEMIDRAPPAKRWKAFGLIFGYPEFAVEFFVEAGLEQQKTGVFVPRDFRHIPTWSSPTGKFVYAVPKNSPIRDEETALLRVCQPILEEYRAWRGNRITNPPDGAMELLRDWVVHQSLPSFKSESAPVTLAPIPPKQRPAFLGKKLTFRRFSGCCPFGPTSSRKSR